jgi:hypothetical protein
MYRAVIACRQKKSCEKMAKKMWRKNGEINVVNNGGKNGGSTKSRNPSIFPKARGQC